MLNLEEIEIIMSITNQINLFENEEIEIELFYESENNKDLFISLGKTEKQQGALIFFEKTFVHYYLFNKKQTLKFEITLSNGKKYTIITSVGKIVGSKNQNMRIPINKDDKIVEFLYKSLPQHSETDYIILEIVCKHLEKSSEELFACLKVNLKLNIPVIPDKDLKYTIKLINSSDIKNKELIYTSEHHKNKKEFSFNETYLNKIVFL